MFDQNVKKRQKGTGFTNIGKITQANVGAGQQMAGKIAQGIQTAGQNAQNKLGQAQQTFKTGFQKATQPVMNTFQQTGGMIKRSDESEEDYAKRIASGQQAQPAQPTTQVGVPAGNQAGTQPTAQPAAPIDYAEIGKQVKEAQYKGPKDLENTEGLLGGAINAAQIGGMTTSNLGQQQLLKQFVAGKQGYTKGQGSLDAMLMGQSGEGQRQLQQARQSVSSLPQDVIAAAKSAQGQATGMERGIEKEKSRILGGVESSVGELEKRAEEKGKLYTEDATRLANLMKGKFANIGYKQGDKGTEFSEAQAAKDKELLRNLDKFGLGGNVDIEALDPEEYQKVVDEIANQANTQAISKYGDPQKAALEKLARFQQDENRAQEVKNIKDKNAFNVSDEDFKNLKSIKNIEAAKQADKEASSEIGRLEGIIGLKDRDTGAYFANAAQLLGQDTINRISDQVEDEEGGLFGSTKRYKEGRKKDMIAHLIQQRLQPMYQARERLSKREQNKLSLKDYIKRFS